MFLQLVQRLRTWPRLAHLDRSPLGRRLHPLLRVVNEHAEKAVLSRYRAGYPVAIGGGAILLDPAFALYRASYGEELLLQAMLERLTPGDTFLDVGSWVGVYAMRAAQVVGSRGRVFAFEPCSPTCSLLMKHVRLNHLEHIIEVIPTACSDQPGYMPLTNQPLSSENRLLPASANAELSHQTVGVAVTTLDRFCAERQVSPDVVKVDVEGAEFQVLRGATELLRRERPLVFCELHPHLWSHFGVVRHQFDEFAATHSYTIHMLGCREAGAVTIEYVLMQPQDSDG